MSAPLTAVLGAMRAGADTLDDVGRRTHLAPDTVRAAVEHLRRIGVVEAEEIVGGCPSGGCGVCPAARAGCASGGSGRMPRGPVLLSLRVSERGPTVGA